MDLICALVLLWGYLLYFCFLKLAKPFSPVLGQGKFNYHMIVPIYNEIELIEEKILNLDNLKLKQTTVYFVDASIDGTEKVLARFVNLNKKHHYIRATKKGRSTQINEVLQKIDNGVVIVSDADAVIMDNYEKTLDQYFSDERVGFLAADVSPQTSMVLDLEFWRQQKKIRKLESRVGHCPVASGTFYAFRRESIGLIPEEVWADDIYVPFRINNQGLHSLVLEEISVTESRAPETFLSLLDHKIRKAKDNIIETLRNVMEKKKGTIWKLVFATRALQLLSPIFVIYFALVMKSSFFVICLLLSLCFWRQAKVFWLASVSLVVAGWQLIFLKSRRI